MGRWAQAQRRGGFTAPVVGFPLDPPDGSEWGCYYDGIGAEGQFNNLSPFPAGADGILWTAGVDGDCDDATGVHTGVTSFGTGLNKTAGASCFAYAWANAGIQASDFCATAPWIPV